MTNIVVTGTRGIPNIMGGVESHCEELFPRIATKGYNVTVICRSNYVVNPVESWKGVRTISVKSPKKKSLEAIIHTFRAINKAKQLDADILHIHAIGPALLVPYAKLRGLHVVFTHHGPDYDRDKWGFFAKTMLKLGERMGCKFADEVIVISDVIKNIVAERCHRTERVHLIYNGVATPEICDYDEYFSELGIEKENYILGMCRFVPEKNMHHLVEAFTKIDTKGCKLVLAGDTDFEDDYSRGLKAMARENGVVLTGFVKGKKLHSLLTNAKCFVLPSSHEGLPIALLEAMSYGINTLVSDIPANKEVGLNQEHYFQCGNIQELANKLQEIVNAPCSHIKYDMEKYDWDGIADQVVELYDNLR